MQVGDDLDSCCGYVLWSGSAGVYLFVNLAIVRLHTGSGVLELHM